MDDTEGNGIPTRAIHEAYLTLQDAHREYRRARDSGMDTHGAKGQFQDAVLTFYELVRPHLKHESALEDYWSGDLPGYTGWNFEQTADARTYVREQGTGVYQVQEHVNTVELDSSLRTDGGLDSLDEWHRVLGLSWDSERLVAVQPADKGVYFVKMLRCAVLSLRELDHWEATVKRERKQGDGFMSGETSLSTTREFQPPDKLVTAKRLLVEAADRLGALSEFEASSQTTEITREDMEKVEQWRQEQLNQ